MAQSVKHQTLDFGSGHDLGSGHDITVYGVKPYVRLCAGSMEPAWDSLFFFPLSHSPLSLIPLLPLPLSAPPLFMLSLSLKIKKHKIK